MDPATAALVAQLVQQEIDRREASQRQPIAQHLSQPMQPAANTPLDNMVSRSDSWLSSRSSSAASSASSFSTPRSNSGPPRCPSRPTKKRSLREIMFVDDGLEAEFPGNDDDDLDHDPSELLMNPAELLKQDRRDLLRPILESFDPLLAPRSSPLFTFQKKKLPNADGCFELKKNEELDLRLWSKLIRSRLKEIMGNSFRNSKLVSRFRHAARKIVCKRRANHNQSWRLYGHHKKLIYKQGGAVRNLLKKKRKLFKCKTLADCKKSRQHQSSTACSTPVPPPDLDADFGSDEDYEESQRPSDDDDVPGTLSDVTRPTATPPPVSSLQPNKTICVNCGKRLEFNSCFPQDHEDWAPSVSRPIRCGECWDSFIQNDVMPEMAERIKKQNSKIRNKQNDGGEQKKKKKKCKCGSVYHTMTTHLDCPLNPRNLRPEEDSQPQQPAKKRTKRTQCKCGSKKHVSIRHKSCPLNRNNVAAASNDGDPASPPPANVPTQQRVPVPPVRYSPKVGDNVLVRYRRNEWFLAHVTKQNNANSFEVYFPEDFRVKKSVPIINIRPVDKKCTEPTRGQLIGKVFNYPGDDDVAPSQWKVRRLISEKNTYFCTCLDPKLTPNADDFEIGYVISCYKNDLQSKYENPFLTSK